MHTLIQPRYWRFIAAAAMTMSTGSMLFGASCAAADLVAVAREVRPKVVKLYGVGGLRQLESYQSGILISAEGHVLTAWSYVLDNDDVTVVLDDGRHFIAHLVGADPLTEVAILKFDAGAEPVPHFELAESTNVDVGTRVLAFSNLFGIATGNEPVSMLHGHVATVAPLEARRGAFSSNYREDVYIVDAATNNPGASGGALTDGDGRLVGMLGKELRSELTGTWLNYALPVDAIAPSVEAILAGRDMPSEMTELERPENPLSFAALGIVLVPNIVARTPPYVDYVIPDSPAAAAGIRPDDLLVMFDSQLATSCRQALRLVEQREHDSTVRVVVLRDEALLDFPLRAKVAAEPATRE